MKHQKAFAAIAVAAALTLGLAFTVVQAQDKDDSRREVKISVKKDLAKMERDLERAIEQIESVRGLRVKIRGPKNFRLDVNLSGLGSMLRGLEKLGREFDGERHRPLTRSEKRQLRRALKKLEDLDIDLDFDIDFDIDIR
ncbi:MAG: hypothetical protein NTZ26_09710 [Candidatus Aminicenantes bacterium]|nr:hypothetical protein [Candidatus Aminicenantes bacterium]